MNPFIFEYQQVDKIFLQNGKNRLLFLCPLKEKQKKEQNPTHTI